MRKQNWGFVLAIWGLLLACLPAFAQNIPSSVEPSRIRGQMTPLQAPLQPAEPPTVEKAPPVAAPEGAAEIKFKLTSLHIEGMTAYAAEDLAPLYQDMIGKTITLTDIFALAEKLTARYRNDGYILAQTVVPPQTIDSGEVVLQIVEGFIDQVAVQNKDGAADTAFIARMADGIKAARPLNIRVLERVLLLLNDLPGVSAQAVLSAAPKTPGASDLTLIITQKKRDLFFQADNRGSRYLGPLQVNAGAGFNNAFGGHERLDVQTVFSPASAVQNASVAYSRHYGTSGSKFSLGAGYTSTRPGFTLSPFDIHGTARTLNLALSLPIDRSRSRNTSVTAKFDWLDSERSGDLGLGGTEDRLRVARFGGVCQIADSGGGSNAFSIEASKGLSLLNASDKGDAGMTRAAGDPQFFKVSFEASRLQKLAGPFDLLLTTIGQISADTLPASEEFGVGGAAFGGAYDASEITGEDGIAARLELRMNTQQPWQPYGFYDIGMVRDQDNAVPRERRRSLASAGMGVRFAVNDNISGTVEAACPLTRDVETLGDKSLRLFASLTMRF